MNRDTQAVLARIAAHLLDCVNDRAAALAESELPFDGHVPNQRSCSERQKVALFVRDGFIDRYSGEQLVNPGFLRLLHCLLPRQFPFHAHGRSELCHDIFWDLLPSVDHVVPLHRGGEDAESNLVTTSMRRNQIKSNWTLEQVGWAMHPGGSLEEWDGLSRAFVQLADARRVENAYVCRWVGLTRRALEADRH
jgi:5-methylcytosine-specific restriction endonuclease McrA